MPVDYGYTSSGTGRTRHRRLPGAVAPPPAHGPGHNAPPPTPTKKLSSPKAAASHPEIVASHQLIHHLASDNLNRRLPAPATVGYAFSLLSPAAQAHYGPLLLHRYVHYGGVPPESLDKFNPKRAANLRALHGDISSEVHTSQGSDLERAVEVGTLAIPGGLVADAARAGYGAVRAAQAAKGGEEAVRAAEVAKAAEATGQAGRAARSVKAVRGAPAAAKAKAAAQVGRVGKAASETRVGRAVSHAATETRVGRTAVRGAQAARPAARVATYPIRKPVRFTAQAQAPVVATQGPSGFVPALTGTGVAAHALGAIGNVAGGVPVAGNILKDAFNLPATAIPSVYLPLRGAIQLATTGNDSELKGLLSQYSKQGLLPAIFRGDPAGALRAIQNHPLYSALEASGAYAVAGRGAGTAARVAGVKAATTARAPLHVYGNRSQQRAYSKNVLTKAGQVGVERFQRSRGRDPNIANEKQAHGYLVGNRIEGHKRSGGGIVHRFIESSELRRRENRTRTVNEHGAARPKRAPRDGVVAEAAQGSLRKGNFHHDVKTRIADLNREALTGNLQKHELAANRTLVKQLAAAKDASPRQVDEIFASARTYATDHNIATDQAVARGLYDAGQVERARTFPYAIRHMNATHGIPGSVTARLAELDREVKAAKQRANAEVRGAAGNVGLARRQEQIAASGREQASLSAATAARIARATTTRVEKAAVTPEVSSAARDVQSLDAVVRELQYAKGKPGISVEGSWVKSGAGPHQLPGFTNIVFRDANGDPRGVFGIVHDPETGDISHTQVIVDPAFRRKGIATKLARAAVEAGFPVHRIGPNEAFTTEGAALRDQLLKREGNNVRVPTKAARRAERAVGTRAQAGERVTQARQQAGADIRDVRRAERQRGQIEAGGASLRQLRKERKRLKATQPRLLGPDGESLTTAQIHEHMRSNGVNPDEVGFLSHRPNLNSARAFNQRAHTRSQIPRKARTGEAFRRGTYDASYEALGAQRAQTQGEIDRARTWDEMIQQQGVKAPNGGYFKDRAQAENYAEGVGGHVPLVPVEIAPWLALRQELEAARKSGGLAAAIDAGLVDRVTQGIHQSLTADTGRFVLMPETSVKSLLDHFKAAGPLQRGATSITQAFKYTVLPTSDKWILGNVLDQGLRAMFSGISPIPAISTYNRLGRRVLNEVERQHGPEVRAQIERQAISGGNYAQRENYRINQASEGLAAAAHKVAQKPVAKQVSWLYGKYAKAVFAGNGWLERQMEVAGLGKAAVEEVRANNGRWGHALGLQKGAVEDVARGLGNTDKQVAFAHAVEDIFGRWRGNSPLARSIISGYAPFYLWARNATRFILLTLPAKHPIKTALIAAAATATEKERKQFGLDLYAKEPVQGYLQGGIPTAGGGILPTGYYSSAGVFANYPGFLSNIILPQVAGLTGTLSGQNFAGQQLTNPDGTPITHPEVLAGLAISSFAEGTVPFLSIARRITEGGGASAPTSTIVTPQTYPHTTPPGGGSLLSGVKRVYVPRIYAKHSVDYGRKLATETQIPIPAHSSSGSSSSSDTAPWNSDTSSSSSGKAPWK